MATPYDAAIKLSLASNVSEGLAVIIARLAGAHAEVKKLEAGLAGLKPAVLGAVAAFAGFETLKFASHIEKAGEELVHVKTMMEAALPVQTRMTDMAKIWASATKEAGSNLRSTFVGNVSALHDLYNITQSVGESGKLLAPFNILKNMMDSAKEKGFSGGSSDASIASAVQALDFAGRTTEEALKPAAEALARTFIGLGRRFDPEKYKTAVGSSGDARFGWNDEFLTKGFPILQALGLGSRAGSAMYQLHSNLFGGGGGALASKIQADAQIKWGLHKESDMIFDGKRFKGFKVGSVFESDKLQANPIAWANDYIAQLKASGVDVADKKTMMLIAGEIGRGNKLLKAAFDELLLPMTNRQLNREMGNIDKIGGDAVALINENDPKAWRQKLAAKWKDLEDIVGEKLVDPFINHVLKPLTEMLRNMSQWGAANSGKLKIIAEGVVALGVALVSVGSVILLTAVFGAGGLLATAVVGLGAFAAIDWKSFVMLTDAIGKFASAIDKLAFSPIETAVNVLLSLGTAVNNFINKLGSWWSGKPTPGSFGGGGFGGGAGITNAAWSGGGGGVGSFGGAGVGGAPSGPWSADAGGIGGNPILSAIEAATVGDPRTRQILRNMYASESGGVRGYAHNPNGEDSWGPFQLNRHGGLGALFERETGLSVRTQSTLGAQARWVADYVRRHRGPLSQWRGLEHPERFGHTYGGYNIEPHRKREQSPVIHNTILLDGDPIHQSVVKRMLKGMTHPTTAPYHDGSRHWTPPDAGLVGV